MIIIARKYGQLGNRLTLFAHLIAASREYGVPLLNPCFAEYASYFPSTCADPWCRYDPSHPESQEQPLKHSSRVTEITREILSGSVNGVGSLLAKMKFSSSFCGVVRLRGDQICDLASTEFRARVNQYSILLTHGWLFRSESLYRKHADAVRRFFRLQPSHENNVRNTLLKCRQECDRLIGLHIRRGDYATFQNGQFYFSDAEYRGWMRSIIDQHPGQKVGFLICSDAPIEKSSFAEFNVFPGPGHLVEDMYALAETDWIVGPPSTFSLWSSFMGGIDVFHLCSKEQVVIVPDSLQTRQVSLQTKESNSNRVPSVPIDRFALGTT